MVGSADVLPATSLFRRREELIIEDAASAANRSETTVRSVQRGLLVEVGRQGGRLPGPSSNHCPLRHET